MDTTPRVVETHISTLFFAGDRVFKLAKRVDLPFLRTVGADTRLSLARREMELNRRFAPDVYLGIADVVEDDRIVDRMVVMRRLPDERRLATLLRRGEAAACLRDVARRVAAAHSTADVVWPDDTDSDRLAQNWSDNLAAITPHVDTIVPHDDFARVRRLAETYVQQSAGLRRARQAAGLVRDGHGDLTADDIYCLDDGARILDCLAFDDDLRVDDILDDIAFLVMDVHRLADAETARVLMEAYQEFSNEHHPASLAHHYVAYRAHVRTKVACLRVEQGDAASAELARSYHDLALHHLERARLRVILVGGGPGVGKTHLSRELADRYGYVHVATDEVRHDVAHIAHGQHSFVPLDEGPYDPVLVDATYLEQRERACSLLRGGHGIVLDASWASSRHRALLRDAVGALDVDVVELECVLDAGIARERIARRLANPDDPSDATPEMVDLLGRRREAWPEATRIDTVASVTEIVDAAVAVVDSR